MLVKEAERTPTLVERVETRESMVVPKAPANANDDEINHEIDLDENYYYSVIKPGSRSPRDRPMIHEAYNCWKLVWGQALKELDGVDRVHSDDFSRQQEFVTLWDGSDCIGMVAFRFVDLASEIASHDSYFKCWPEHALARVRASSRVVCVMSNMTVHPGWRGRRGNTTVKELLSIMALYRFSIASPACCTAVGTTRNNRGVTDLMYRYSATPLVRDVMLHGVEVDLVSFSRWGVRSALQKARPHSAITRLTSEGERRTA